MSVERHTERTKILEELKSTNKGTDTVPGQYISICREEENVGEGIISWAEKNATYQYVDKKFRGESTLNGETAYLVIDLDFGESKNYYVKSNNNIYSVHYVVEQDTINADINKIIGSLKF